MDIPPERWRRIKDVFEQALDRESADRPSFIVATCAGDDDLRYRVEQLLAADALSGGFLDRPLIRLPNVRVSQRPDPSSVAANN
jgi:hypothetical protein